MDNSARFRTRAVHAGHKPDPQTGAHAMPIYATSTFTYGTAERGGRLFAGEEQGYFYSRIGNPTVRAFEEKLASLEGTEDAVAFASGMGATSAIPFTLLRSGDELAFIAPLYGGTEGFFRDMLPGLGIKVWEAKDVDDLRARMTPQTKIVWLETPTNPILSITDLKAVCDVAHAGGAKVVVDNTFSTPYLTRPTEYGVDLVVHSATKYLCGHGDALAGIVAGDAETVMELRVHGLRHVGAVLGPFEAYLLLRGMKTLALRMEAHCESAMQLATELAKRDDLKVYYPGLPTHPGHEIAARQMSGKFGGLVSLDLGDFGRAQRFLDNLKLFIQAVSLGDVESLSSHPASTTHQLLGEEILNSHSITPGLVRLSLGIEDPADLMADVMQALAAADRNS